MLFQTVLNLFFFFRFSSVISLLLSLSLSLSLPPNPASLPPNPASLPPNPASLPPNQTTLPHEHHQLNKRGKNVGATLANQADSNLVLYDADGKPANWASNTKGGEGSYLTVSDDGRALYTSGEGVLLWSSNGKDVGGKGAPAPGSAEAEAEAAAPPAGDSDAHDPPMVQGGDAAPASVEQEGSGVVQMASIAASGGVGDHPIEFIAEVKV